MVKRILYLVCLSLFFEMFSVASCMAGCSAYLGKGYCTDYVRQRLGSKPSGNAKTWVAGGKFVSVESANVTVDDIAVFISGTHGHVAVVDSVSGDNITISEWNYGATSINSGCGVTNLFGKLHNPSRTIAKSSVTRFLRLSTEPQVEEEQEEVHQPIIIAYKRVLDQDISVYWTPANVSCVNATAWCYGTCSASFTNSICNTAYDALLDANSCKYASQDWQYTFFGNQAEFDSVQSCSSN